MTTCIITQDDPSTCAASPCSKNGAGYLRSKAVEEGLLAKEPCWKERSNKMRVFVPFGVKSSSMTGIWRKRHQSGKVFWCKSCWGYKKSGVERFWCKRCLALDGKSFLVQRLFRAQQVSSVNVCWWKLVWCRLEVVWCKRFLVQKSFAVQAEALWCKSRLVLERYLVWTSPGVEAVRRKRLLVLKVSGVKALQKACYAKTAWF